MAKEPEPAGPEREPIVLSRASTELYQEMAALCERWDDIEVVVDRRVGMGEHGFILPRDGELQAGQELPEIP